MEVRDLGTQATAGKDGQQPDPGATGTDDAARAAAAASEKPTRPEWLPESYFDAEKSAIKLDDFGKHYGELATASKAEAERIAAYPAKVEDLKFTLPADLKLPEGMTLDDKNPQYQAFRNFVFDKKIDPAVGSEMLGMYVRQQVADVDAINKRVDEELGKLGVNGPARITALRTFFDGLVGNDLSKSLMAGLFTEPQVRAMEKVMLALSNQGTQRLNGGSRDDKPEGVTDEEYEAMSPRQRLEYARSKQKPA